MNKKEVTINGIKFIISYFSGESQVQHITKLNVYRTIVALYLAPNLEREEYGRSVVESCEPQLMKEIKKLVEANQDFYKHFDYQFDFVSWSLQLGRHNGQEVLISIELGIEIKLKS